MALSFEIKDLGRLRAALHTHIGHEQYKIWKDEEEENETRKAKEELRKLTSLLIKIKKALPEEETPEVKKDEQKQTVKR